MSKAVKVTAVSLVIFVLAGATNSTLAETSSPVPPKNLKLVGDHWTPWDPPEAGPDAYIIKKGDTLWDLAAAWLGDPFLWPQIWDENRYILDSHWIYPGDPLVVPGKPTVIEPGGPPEEAIPEDVVETPVDPGFGRDEPEEQPELVPLPPALVPVADISDIYCSGYIDPEPEDLGLSIVGHELEREHLGQGDIVYINQGSQQGLKPGVELAIRRITNEVTHPETGASLGMYVRRMGKIRLIAVQENTATAIIEEACEDIVLGDILLGWEEIPIPMISSLPEFDRYDVTPSGGPVGMLVATNDDVEAVGGGHVVYTDLGFGAATEPGDLLTIYRENGDLPRLMIGQAIVLTVEPLACTAKITKAVREAQVGDRVEVAR